MASTIFSKILLFFSLVLKNQNSLDYVDVANISSNAQWSVNGTTIIDGLRFPWGVTVDPDDGTVYVADSWNNRIISHNPTTNETRTITRNISRPFSVLLDKKTNSIIFGDYDNKRVLTWSLANGTTHGKTIINNINCIGIVMDSNGILYVVDNIKHEVRRFQTGQTKGLLVAGGNGEGSALNQLNSPRYIAIDRKGAIYVTDCLNHRVVKWMKGAKEGIIVAGGNGKGSNLNQLSYPEGILIDANETIYVAEGANDRITRWRKGQKIGEILVGGNEEGNRADQLNGPIGLSFDKQNNLYVADQNNDRIQRFDLV